MPFDLNEFRNNLQLGGARPSQFEMNINWPSGISLPADVAGATSQVPFLCQISEIPGSTIGNFTIPYFGRKLHYAGDRIFDSLTITVINDEDFKIRQALEAWMAAVQHHGSALSDYDGGQSAISGGTYVADSIVIQYSRNQAATGSGGAAIAKYRFVGMWPSILSPIALNWDSSDQIETYTCQFYYQWWESLNPSSETIAIA